MSEPAGAPAYDIVVPSIGRPSLAVLLASLEDAGAVPGRLVVVDDRHRPCTALDVPAGAEIVCSRGRGPAAARNAGAARANAPWIVFLDDDVVVRPGWGDALARDLAEAPAAVVAVQGRIDVPLPAGRRPTDWERNVAALASAPWITADLAVRRAAFEAVGGFDEGFRRAYREDSDLAVRLRLAGGALRVGDRRTSHPVRPVRWTVSLRAQAGNADDARLAARWGRRWRAEVGEGPSALPGYAVTCATAATGAVAAVAGALSGRRRPGLVAAAGAVWVVRTARFAARRIGPGPRTPAEVATMTLTSAAIPPVALAQRVRGRWRHRDVRAAGPPARTPY